MEAAREAAQRLNGYSLEGGVLRVDRLMDRRRGPRGASAGPGVTMGGRMGGAPGMTSPSQRHTDFPLRILVLSEMVGAIIGRQGSTIRTITQQVYTVGSVLWVKYLGNTVEPLLSSISGTERMHLHLFLYISH